MLARTAVVVTLTSLISAIGMLTIGTPPAAAQIGITPRQTYVIAGTVRNENYQSMDNVRVDLTTPTGAPLNSTVTRPNGQFQFDGLLNGAYIVQVLADGYDPAKKGVTLSDSSSTGLSISVSRPFKMSGASSGGSVVSVHELTVPGKAREEFQKGLVLASAKSDFHGSIIQFERAINIYPNYFEAYTQEGNAYLMLHEPAQAETALRKAVELSSGKFSDALFMLAGLLNDANRFAEAEPFARQLSDLNSTSWEGPYELARAQAGLKRVEDAEKNAVKARDSKPDNAPVYLVLANIHILRHDYPSLLNDLDAYLKIAPSGPAAQQARKTRDDIKAMQEQQNRTNADSSVPGNTDGDDSLLPDLPPASSSDASPIVN
jgi:Flp pilus assembly protein TadD